MTQRHDDEQTFELACHDSFEASPALFTEGACASDIIEGLLLEHGALRIPHIAHPLLLNRPIILGSGMRLSIHEDTVLRMMDGCGGCMLRNEHVFNGCDGSIDEKDRDSDILIEGGIWEEAPRDDSHNDGNAAMRQFSRRHLILGVLFFCHAEKFVARKLTIRRGEEYGVLLSSCRHFVVEDIYFDDHHKDGVHVNGPSEWGLIQNLRGTCGDDFVALNAWDWDSSAVSFGPIRHMRVQHIACERDEMRLLPGRKVYGSGEKTDCPVENCVFSDISGVYNFKLYQQPNCHNASRAVKDSSEVAGIIRNVLFSGIRLDSFETEGLAEVCLDGLFEIGADTEGLVFENISLGFPARYLTERHMALVAVGPKSSTWTRGFDDPDRWAELFDPDLVCVATDTAFTSVRFADMPCRDEATLISAHRLSVNENYPATKPKGGTGYGVIQGVRIES